jgi:signal transduction histidine kinase
MTFYAFSGLLNGLVSTVLGVFFYSRAPHNPRHRAYGLYCLSLSIWSYFYLAWQLAESRDAAFLYTRLLMAGAILIPAFYLYHVLTLLDRVEEHRTLLNIGYALSGIFLLFDATPLFIADLQPEMSFQYWPKPGVVFHVYLLWFIGFVTYATYLILAAYRQAKGLQRNQYLWLAIGSLIGYGGGSTNFPLWYGIPIPPSGTILVTTYTVLVAFILVRYHLLDFSVALEKGLTYLLLLIAVAVPMLAIIIETQKAYFGEANYPFSAILLCLFLLLILGGYKLKSEAQTAISRTFFRHRYDMYETLSEFSKALVAILDLKSLTEEIVHTLVQVIGIRTAALYLLDKEKDLYALSCSHGFDRDGARTLRLTPDDPLVHHMRCDQAILVREELEHTVDSAPTRPIIDSLAALHCEVCIPLVNKDRLIGFCTLGARANHRMYSREDLSLLTALGQNAAIALDNAMLYEDLKSSQSLMRRTDRLRSLETIAGGFAHEVRNPLTSIKTFVQLAAERKDDPEFFSQFSKVVIEDVDRIERLIQEILDYARYMQPKFLEEDFNEVVSSSLYFIEVKAESKSIAIERDLAPDLPRVLLDRQHIIQVLMNLFLNALDAMAGTGGRLTVRTHRLRKAAGDPWIQIEVADTGSGISPGNLEHIFDPFYTTKHESTEREGTGLGLAIVHQIVQEHHGSIKVESTVGQGTTFFIDLPVNPLQHTFRRRREEHEETDTVGRR